MNDIISSEYTEAAIASSRSIQEILRIHQGDSAYGVLASIISDNINSIDSFAENMGQYVAQSMVKNVYDQQFFNPKYGKFKNFLTRNIYLSKQKKQEMEKERAVTGLVASAATEAGIKFAGRAIQYWSNEKAKYEALSNIYSLLYSYSQLDSDNSNIVKANIELSKIRNSFPLSTSDKKKLCKKIHGAKISLEDLALNSSFAEYGDNSLIESISYMLFSIHCQKYGEEKQYNLLDYYNLLGYHGNFAKEIIRENKEKYLRISNDQIAYLKMSRGMVRDMFVSIPQIDVERLKMQAINMAKYDPYSIRRNKNQNLAASGAMTLAAVFTQRPELVIHAGATALTQIDMENNDNGLEFLEKKFKDSGIGTDVFNLMLKERKSIDYEAKENIYH